MLHELHQHRCVMGGQDRPQPDRHTPPGLPSDTSDRLKGLIAPSRTAAAMDGTQELPPAEDMVTEETTNAGQTPENVTLKVSATKRAAQQKQWSGLQHAARVGKGTDGALFGCAQDPSEDELKSGLDGLTPEAKARLLQLLGQGSAAPVVTPPPPAQVPASLPPQQPQPEQQQDTAAEPEGVPVPAHIKLPPAKWMQGLRVMDMLALERADALYYAMGPDLQHECKLALDYNPGLRVPQTFWQKTDVRSCLQD